ncbi:MAG TPA: peptidoglycan editing factor PgeF [Candidatus Binataceae bacterium]|nr:peptidoglycan editing factor PgeF [Candidatus Binataceae bacterium]
MLLPWPKPGLAAGFLGRLGGVSRGAFGSMNMSDQIGDEPRCVAENWRRLLAALAPGLIFARSIQVHGIDVRVVTRADANERPQADAMVTREAGIVLGIMTADCVPVLLSAPDYGTSGAMHAGWRGVIGGIAGAGIRAMNSIGAPPESIRAALGPSIGPCCFEVDRTLAERFSAEVPGADRHRREGRSGKAYLDLRAIVRDQLIAAGVAADAIESVGPCTRCAADRYFSRRAAGGATTGLQLSFAGFGHK